MAFYLLFVCGFFGGLLGGMGMGGGTALIPLLTFVCSLPQTVAQGVNLLSFLPMSAAALAVHAKSGLLRKDGLLFIVLPALLLSVGGALLASFLPAALLKKLFGFFLIGLSVDRFLKIRKDFGKNPEKSAPNGEIF